MPVPVFLAVTSTPGINAFEASETVPPNVALVVWANVLIEKTTHTNNIAEQTYVFPFIFSPFIPIKVRLADTENFVQMEFGSTLTKHVGGVN
jgi:hypothetical protein